jgi:hypothetical protein
MQPDCRRLSLSISNTPPPRGLSGYCPSITALSTASDLYPMDASFSFLWIRIDSIVYSALPQITLMIVNKNLKMGQRKAFMCKRLTTKEGVASNDYALKSYVFVEVDNLCSTGSYPHPRSYEKFPPKSAHFNWILTRSCLRWVGV